MNEPRHNDAITVVPRCDNGVSCGRLDKSSKNKFDLVLGAESDEHVVAPRVVVSGVEEKRNQENCWFLIGVPIQKSWW